MTTPEILPGFTVGELVWKDSLECDIHEGVSDSTGENVAIKFISKNSMLIEDVKKRLDNELACLSKLKHTNIQNLLQVIENPQHIVRVYDYSTGGNVRQYFLQKQQGFSLDWEQSQTVMLQITAAVTHLHTHSIVHKDLTLDNIGLVVKGSSHHVKITGFYECVILESSEQDVDRECLTAGNRSYDFTDLIYLYSSHVSI